MLKNILIKYICSNPNCGYFIDKFEVEHLKIDILKQCPRCKSFSSFEPLFRKKNDLSEIVNKIQAIALNVKKIFKEDLGIVNKNNYNEFNIEIDLSDQYDEFYITVVEAGEKINLCHLEVVTREIAISNDKELLNFRYTPKEIENDYEVGNTLSYYKKLGDSIYYYKEM